MVDALAYREQQRDDAERTLRMLRHTLTERVKACETEMRDDDGDETDEAYRFGKAQAYRDALSLLGPEEPDTYDESQPF